MRKINSILPLVFALGLSIALHGAIFHINPLSFGVEESYVPAETPQEQGHTVIKLTLNQAIASAPKPPKTALPKLEKQIFSQPKGALERTKPQQKKQSSPLDPPNLDTEPYLTEEKNIEPVNDTEAIPINDVIQSTEQEEAKDLASEQISSIEQEEGVSSNAIAQNSIKPNYPMVCIRRRLEGTVILDLHIGSEGYLKKAEVYQSSGNKLFDKSALKAAQKTIYIPAMKNGTAIDSILKQTYIFKLPHE